MATLTGADYTYIRQWTMSQPTIRAEMRVWSLPKATWENAIQATENYMVSGFSITPTTSIRAAIEAATGATTATRAQYIYAAWVAWKLRNLLGG